MYFKGEHLFKREIDLEKLKSLERELSTRLNAEGVPVDDNCRIKMSDSEDIRLTEKLKKEWEERGGEKIKKDGEQFEILKTIIFNKFLSRNFLVVRASLYDDIRNKVDNVILDKDTGSLVCAVDEVASISGKEFEDKKQRVLARNTKEGGGKLKYGLRTENGKIKLEKTEHFPLFYLALPPDRIKEAINKMEPTFDEKTDYEKRLFSYFLSSINSQIKALKLYPHLDQTLKTSISFFESAFQKFEK